MDKRNNWIQCIIAIIATAFFSVLSGFMTDLIPQGTLCDTDYGTLTYLLMGVINLIAILIILACCKRTDILKNIPSGSFIKGVTVAIVLFGYSVITFIINIISCIRMHSDAVMSPLFVALYIIALFIGAGIGEELIFRGVFMSFIRGAVGYRSRKGLIIGMSVSSIAFGLMHLSNLLVTDDVLGTIGQVIYAIGIGFYLAAVYARTGNLWFNIVLHFLVDIASFVKEIFTSSEVSVTEILGGGQISVIILSVFIGVVFFAMGMFIIRKKKMPDLV